MSKRKLDNPKLKKLLQEKGRLITKARELAKKAEEINNEQRSVGYKVDRLKKKYTPLVQEEQDKMDLGEFEFPAIYLDEKTGDLVYEVIDEVEEFKKARREQNEDNSADSDNKEEG
jgi:hypothetical protein